MSGDFRGCGTVDISNHEALRIGDDSRSAVSLEKPGVVLFINRVSTSSTRI